MSDVGSLSLGAHVRAGAVAMLVQSEAALYLGTCFPFRFAHRFLTARHCTDGLGPADLAIRTQYGQDLRVVDVHRHPDFDIAMLEGDPAQGGVPYPFAGLPVFAGTYGVAEDVVTFGFPVGGTLVEEEKPTPRFFRGYTQRLADFASGGSKPYRAYELSFPAPAGLSGGPVFPPASPDRAFAVVTGLLESYTIRDEETVVRDDNHTHTTEARRVISYGMALSLYQVDDWLKQVAPLSGSALW